VTYPLQPNHQHSQPWRCVTHYACVGPNPKPVKRHMPNSPTSRPCQLYFCNCLPYFHTVQEWRMSDRPTVHGSLA